MTRTLIALIEIYKRWLSPAIHTLGAGGCRFQPTCSEYAMRAVAMHGPMRGSGLALWRILRCHPFSKGGLDQVPSPARPESMAQPLSSPEKPLP